MRRYGAALIATFAWCAVCGPVRAGEDAREIVDKGIQALGGEAKLRKIAAFSWTANASIKTNNRVSESVLVVTIQGLDQVKRDFRTRAPFRVMVNGDKGWYTAGGQNRPMSKDALDIQKRTTYLQVVPTLLVPLKGRGFQYEVVGKEVVRGKPATILKIVGPDARDFTLSFDNETHLPVKEVALSRGLDGKERLEQTFFGKYKEMGGIKKATSIEARIDDENYGYFDIVSFEVLDPLPPGYFSPRP